MANDNSRCNAAEVDRLSSSRNYIQVPDPCNCPNRKTIYYGITCQFMQVNDSTRTIRGDPTPIRTWNRDSREFCRIGEQITPPGSDTLTVDFYEMCRAGIPLPLTLDLCRWRVIVNHGLCRSQGNHLTSWSGYVEVYDLLTNTQTLGRRTSFDGADDPRTISLSATVFNHYYVGPMNFTPVNFNAQQICVGGTIVMGKPSFACNVGCGDLVCNCQQPCGDGSDTWYVPMSCAGSAAQYLVTFTNCGTNFVNSTLPAPTITGQIAFDRPLTAQCGSVVYYLGYQNPPALYSISADANGRLNGPWTKIADLPRPEPPADPAPNSGTPAQLICENGTIHVLVSDTTGARYYHYNPALNLFIQNTPSRVFSAQGQFDKLAVCGDTLVASGAVGTVMEISTDNGNNWRTLPVSTAMAGITIRDVGINEGRIWVVDTAGKTWYTSDQGFTWTTVDPNVGASNSNINSNSLVFSSDDVGFVLGQGGIASTWTGGLGNNEWTSQAPRINGYPAGFNGRFLATPECGPAWKQASTALVVNDAGDQLLLGQTVISGS